MQIIICWVLTLTFPRLVWTYITLGHFGLVLAFYSQAINKLAVQTRGSYESIHAGTCPKLHTPYIRRHMYVYIYIYIYCG